MNLREKWRSRQRHSLLENTVMLYILQFSNMALGMLTQGYKMRVLGVELVGLLGAAQYTANFFLIFLDFGFLLSATAKISARREDKQELSRILSCVVAAKVIFTLISAVVLTLLPELLRGLNDPAWRPPCCRTICTGALSRCRPSPYAPWL